MARALRTDRLPPPTSACCFKSSPLNKKLCRACRAVESCKKILNKTHDHRFNGDCWVRSCKL